MKVWDDLFPFPDKLLCCVCLVNRRSSSIFTLVELDFTWGQGVFDNTSLSPSYRYLNYNQHGPPQKECIPNIPTVLSAAATRAETRPSLINTDSLGEVFSWLTVIDSAIRWFVSALRHNWLAIRKLGRELLDYYSERLSVSLHQIPYLIHLSFSLQNILVIFNNIAGWYGGIACPFDILYPWLNNDGS